MILFRHKNTLPLRLADLEIRKNRAYLRLMERNSLRVGRNLYIQSQALRNDRLERTSNILQNVTESSYFLAFFFAQKHVT
ncbi:hypothetical protein SPSYN_01957 [Sporotomaculum syntrophicum]|uniref:Uncharacterized protein n=1 Tax=Sporotomaculum syntrophicum TaxID=182264 RepID=A0A9D2WQK3_9FIRM|nr:hypothetical protein SPSYN_01957 [Sporotomaculum syntrophicum]